MILSPILRVLSAFRREKVKALLIGGQACIAYGAAEFSRDSDFVVLASPGNLAALGRALKALKATPLYFTEQTPYFLLKGHACHFRCGAPAVAGLRVDVMARLKGCEPFEKLWPRRTRLSIPGVGRVNIISLEDLVLSKKTQRDKDWLMLGRLVENDVFARDGRGPAAKVRWWLAESRDPETLAGLCAAYPGPAAKAAVKRPLLREASKGRLARVSVLLKKEEAAERARDIEYWAPLKKELEALRLARPR